MGTTTRLVTIALNIQSTTVGIARSNRTTPDLVTATVTKTTRTARAAALQRAKGAAKATVTRS